MDEQSLGRLESLIQHERVAALGTLDPDGSPRLAMVPIAIDPRGGAFLIHVSHLAQHTRDLALDPRAALLLAEEDRPSRNPATLARVAFQGRSEVIEREAPVYAELSSAYLARHPASEITFQLGDFVLCRIAIDSARFVAGFGRAFDVSTAEIASIMGGDRTAG